MVFVDVVALALVVGLCLGGSLSNLAHLELRGVWLFYAAIGLQIVAFPADVLPWSMNDAVARILWLGSYALLLGAAWQNRELAGVPRLTAGMLCNVAAVLANGGHMPVRPQALVDAHLAYRLHNNSISAAHAHLPWLIDRWAAPGWLPLANVFSVGDVAIGAGVFALVLSALRPRLVLPRTLRGQPA